MRAVTVRSSNLVTRLLTVFIKSERPSPSVFLSSPMGTEQGTIDSKLLREEFEEGIRRRL